MLTPYRDTTVNTSAGLAKLSQPHRGFDLRYEAFSSFENH